MRIFFEGKLIECVRGDSIAAALLAAGERAWRETPDGARGLFCGMGVCHECAVSVDGAPGVRACMTSVRDGMEVSRHPALPRLDRAHATLARKELSPDVLVVGGGAAGLTAAAASAECGADVVLVDERGRLGGQYFKQPATGRIAKPDSQQARGAALVNRVERSAVTVLSGAQVWGAASPDEVFATDATTAYTIRPRRLVLAPGAYERGVPLPGWTLPGYMTAGAAQTLQRSYGAAPGKRVLLSGNGPFIVQVAADLIRAGTQVVAVAELAERPGIAASRAAAALATNGPGLALLGARYLATLRRARVPILYGSAVIRAEGDGAVERAVVSQIGADGRPVPGREREFEVDTVCAGFGFVASTELARLLGCRHEDDPAGGQLVTVTDGRGRSSVENVWVVGDGARVAGAPIAQASGLLAGLDVARSLDLATTQALAAEERSAARARRRSERFQRALWRVYRAPLLLDELAEPGTLVCRCENVTLGRLRDAFSGGAGAVGSAKRLTRAGMGRCQSRYCAALLVELSRRHGATTPDELDWPAPQAPVRLVQVGDASDS